MSASGYRTVLVGLGWIGAGMAEDPRTARHIRYATHAQVLSDHPRFDWCGAVDIEADACRQASERWGIPVVGGSIEEVCGRVDAEVVVLATPPGDRRRALDSCGRIRAALVEKPLGRTCTEAAAFVRRCSERHITLQVNYTRRADETYRQLMAGELEHLLGRPQAVFGVYGNGLLNNGAHMVDVLRMLLGEAEGVRALGPIKKAGPSGDDWAVPFQLSFGSGLMALMHPLDFDHYRENAIDIWGSLGRLQVVNEGLSIALDPRSPSRLLAGAHEIDSGSRRRLPSTVGTALYRMYDNLARAVDGEDDLWSPGESAMRTAAVVDAIVESAKGAREERSLR